MLPIGSNEELLKKATEHAKLIDADLYLYSGTIERVYDLFCIDTIYEHSIKSLKKQAILILVTNGGSPDAAYKIARYFQDKYEKFSVLVSGMCKSAGTLIALGAHEVIFTPFGELGPLDIQVGKVDKFDGAQSGLTIQEAFNTLESRATASFYKVVQDYMEANDGLLSYHLATQAAATFVTQLYAPVMARIDPEEVGARSRSMQIANEYGKRLEVRGQNLKPNTLKNLAEKYPSHSFVIDHREAQGLFKQVREATVSEKAVVDSLGRLARFPSGARGSGALLFKILTPAPDIVDKPTKRKASDDKAKTRGRASTDRANPSRAAGSAVAKSRSRLKAGTQPVAKSRANGTARG